MRNLKRALSLVLASVMLLGMMAIGAGAASVEFTDQAELQYPEAAAVLSGLRVIEGIPDGDGLAFTPGKVLTRAEAATMLCRFLMGRTNADKLSYNTQIFIDVPATHYAAGCIAYCANLGYITGDGEGKFMPDQPLTGSAWAKLLLVAAGYDPIVEKMANVGDAWAQNVATLALANGIDIAGVPLDNAVTREQAIQMLFQLLDVDVVDYKTEVFGGVEKAFPTDLTVAEKYYPELHEFEGVVTANEWADLYSDEPLPAGKTDIGGKVYDVSTEITDIGESRKGWANGDEVLYLVDTGDNGIFETGDATTINDRNVGLDLDNETEYFLNFGQNANDYYTSDYQISYYVDVITERIYADSAADALAAFDAKYDLAVADRGVIGAGTDLDGDTWFDVEYDNPLARAAANSVVSFRPDRRIPVADMNIIKEIFYSAGLEPGATVDDYGTIVYGEVYVGTQYVKDISDEESYRAFFNEYINSDLGYDAFAASVNGDWLKVIDNDGDGDADIVLLTEFIMDEVVSLSKRGVLTLNDIDGDSDTDEETFGGTNDIPFVSSADLVRGDVVLYTVIDGTCYVELAPNFTGTVDKYTYKTETLTVDGEDYVASQIEEHTGYQRNLENALKDTEYIYYEDWFGHIRVFAIPAAATRDLVLLTDAFYATYRAGDEYAVKAYLDGAINDYDVNSRSTGGFIRNLNNDRNGWEKLVEFWDDPADFSAPYDGEAATNLARYALNDEGVMSLSNAKTYIIGKRGQETGIRTDYVDLAEADFSAGETDFAGTYTMTADDIADGFIADTGNVTVQANNSTVFYYVSYATGTPVVKTVTGYRNSVSVIDSIFDIYAMYAVATNVRGDSSVYDASEPYWVADAIVIETHYPVFESDDDVVFGYNVLNKTVRDYGDLEAVMSDASLKDLYVAMVNGVAASQNINYNGMTYRGTIPTPVFYMNTIVDEDDSYIYAIEENFADHGIYIALVDRKVDLDDYIVALDSARTHLWYTEETVVYDLSVASSGRAVNITSEDRDGDPLELETNSYYIIYADRNEIVYAVLADAITADLAALIYDDAQNGGLNSISYVGIDTDVTPNKEYANAIDVSGLPTSVRGDEIVLGDTFAANTGYTLEVSTPVAADNATLSVDLNGDYILTNITGNVTVYFELTTPTDRNITFNATAGMSWTVDGVEKPASVATHDGAVLTITITPTDGNEVDPSSIGGLVEVGANTWTYTVNGAAGFSFTERAATVPVELAGGVEGLTYGGADIPKTGTLDDVGTVTLTAKTGYDASTYKAVVTLGGEELVWNTHYSYTVSGSSIIFDFDKAASQSVAMDTLLIGGTIEKETYAVTFTNTAGATLSDGSALGSYTVEYDGTLTLAVKHPTGNALRFSVTGASLAETPTANTLGVYTVVIEDVTGAVNLTISL